jgi:hypothetical protein
MLKMSSLSSTFYEFEIPDLNLIPEILNQIKSLEKCKNITTTNNMLRVEDKDFNYSYYNETLFSWFSGCIQQIVSLEFKDTITLEITECWATRTDRFQRHHVHTHPNSIVSGILYLQGDETTTTNFYYPNIWAWTSPVLNIIKPENDTLVYSIKPEPGKLVLFPSNIKHGTSSNTINLPRYTIAFNTFMKGSIGKQSSYLCIDPVTVENVYKNT